jgi:hypothetical protein
MLNDSSMVVRSPARSGTKATCSPALGAAPAGDADAGIEAAPAPARAHNHSANVTRAGTDII